MGRNCTEINFRKLQSLLNSVRGIRIKKYRTDCVLVDATNRCYACVDRHKVFILPFSKSEKIFWKKTILLSKDFISAGLPQQSDQTSLKVYRRGATLRIGDISYRELSGEKLFPKYQKFLTPQKRVRQVAVSFQFLQDLQVLQKDPSNSVTIEIDPNNSLAPIIVKGDLGQAVLMPRKSE